MEDILRFYLITIADSQLAFIQSLKLPAQARMATRASSDGNASLELGNRATAADAKISCRLVEVSGLRV